MKSFKTIGAVAVGLASAFTAFAESSYDIAAFYEVTKPASGTKAVGRYDTVVEVEYLLTPTKVDTGKYVVEVKKIGDDLYQILDTDICVETKYCHEWASFSEKVVLIVESNYGYRKGKIIFD